MLHNQIIIIKGFAGSLRNRQIGLDPEPSGADSLHVSGCTSQVEFDAAASIATNARIHISGGLQTASGKGKFLPDNSILVRTALM